jgi:3-phenylpropionate/trans-cinnamate dioxygenase ferredoxin reductase subunit
MARTAGARCYTDPFVSSGEPAGQPTMARRLTGWLNNPRSGRPIVRPAKKQASQAVMHRAAFSNVR